MKKLLCALLALAMLCACAAAETVDVTGTWYLNELLIGEAHVNAITFAGKDALILTLNGNGTATVDGYIWAFIEASAGIKEANLNGEAIEGTWEMRGDWVVITIKDSAIKLALTDGSLVFCGFASGEAPTETYVRLLFRREAPEETLFDPGTPLTDVTLEDFDGTWFAFIIRIDDLERPSTALFQEMVVELSGGEGRFLEKISSDEQYEDPVVGELVDGELLLSFASDGQPLMMNRLYDSGVMVGVVFPDDDYVNYDFVICFARAQ